MAKSKTKPDVICKRCCHVRYTTTRGRAIFQALRCGKKGANLIDDQKMVGDMNKYHGYAQWIATPEHCNLLDEK